MREPQIPSAPAKAVGRDDKSGREPQIPPLGVNSSVGMTNRLSVVNPHKQKTLVSGTRRRQEFVRLPQIIDSEEFISSLRSQYFARIACKLLKQRQLIDDLNVMFPIYCGQNIGNKYFNL